MAGNSKLWADGRVRGAVAIILLALLVLKYPLFHIEKTDASLAAGGRQPGTPAFDAAAAAAQIWTKDLLPAAQRAVRLDSFIQVLLVDPALARKKYAELNQGAGAGYYFVGGSGTVVAREKNYVRVALDGAPSAVIQLRTGPVFGNTVRDGCGLLDVNSFPGVQEFNAIAAELNLLVEKEVVPGLREKATVGTHLDFVGCAEAPESVGAAGEPVLSFIPVKAEIR